MDALRTREFDHARRLAIHSCPLSDEEAECASCLDLQSTFAAYLEELLAIDETEESDLISINEVAAHCFQRVPPRIGERLRALALWNEFYDLAMRWTEDAVRALRHGAGVLDASDRLKLIDAARLAKLKLRDREAENLLTKCLLQGTGPADRTMLYALFEMTEGYFRTGLIREATRSADEVYGILLRTQTMSAEALSETEFWMRYFDSLHPDYTSNTRPSEFLWSRYMESSQRALDFYAPVTEALGAASPEANDLKEALDALDKGLNTIETVVTQCGKRLRLHLLRFAEKQEENKKQLLFRSKY